jgi:hypothetical protein
LEVSGFNPTTSDRLFFWAQSLVCDQIELIKLRNAGDLFATSG